MGAGLARALPQHMRTLQTVLPRPQALKHSRVPLGFMVEVRRLLCRAIPARQALRMYQLSAQELQRLPVCKVRHPAPIAACSRAGRLTVPVPTHCCACRMGLRSKPLLLSGGSGHRYRGAHSPFSGWQGRRSWAVLGLHAAGWLVPLIVMCE